MTVLTMDQYRRPLPMTLAQAWVFRVIDEILETWGIAPTLREIQEELQYRSATPVKVHIDNLIAKGWLARDPGYSRNLRVLHRLAELEEPKIWMTASGLEYLGPNAPSWPTHRDPKSSRRSPSSEPRGGAE